MHSFGGTWCTSGSEKVSGPDIRPTHSEVPFERHEWPSVFGECVLQRSSAPRRRVKLMWNWMKLTEIDIVFRRMAALEALLRLGQHISICRRTNCELWFQGTCQPKIAVPNFLWIWFLDVSDISLTSTSVKNSMGPNLSPNGSIICILFAKSYAEIVSLVQVLVSVLWQICLILNASKMVVLTCFNSFNKRSTTTATFAVALCRKNYFATPFWSEIVGATDCLHADSVAPGCVMLMRYLQQASKTFMHTVGPSKTIKKYQMQQKSRYFDEDHGGMLCGWTSG